MRNTVIVLKREMASYFATPLAYVFIVIYLALSGAFTFYLGNFFERDQADLQAFFSLQPWVYLVLVPAVSMRLWAEERKTGTIELFMTLPITLPQAVLGKFLAAWLFTIIAIALTFPIWVTVNYLGNPDNGAILAGYIGCAMMAGGYLAIGGFISATTKNQVIAFVLTTTLCFVFTAMSAPVVMGLFSGWAPAAVLDFLRTLGFMYHFNDISKGVIDIRDVVFFATVIALFLFLNAVVVQQRKAN
ncbi:MAG: ABC transporter permease [Alphaproteobacteria bacterium]